MVKRTTRKVMNDDGDVVDLVYQIGADVGEIKSDVKSLKESVKQNAERLAILRNELNRTIRLPPRKILLRWAGGIITILVGIFTILSLFHLL